MRVESAEGGAEAPPPSLRGLPEYGDGARKRQGCNSPPALIVVGHSLALADDDEIF